jgi:L,D-transpeptidase YbiS
MLQSIHNVPMSEPFILVDLQTQCLQFADGHGSERVYPVSTAAKGAGERNGSGCTPRGLHRVRCKIGAGCAPGAVFRGRRWTGEIYSDALARCSPGRDWILTRILWLTGLEPGRNRGGEVDTLRRFIYIHGCPPCEPMGEPRSHGCIRMHDADLIDLFDKASVGTLVEIRSRETSA